MQLFRFIIEICSTASSPFYFNLDTWRIPIRPSEMSICIYASFFWISWKEARGTPNCLRYKTYCLARWKQNSAAPRVPHEIPNLALLRQENGPLRPFTVGKTFLFGTLTSSITISPVIDAFNDNFPFILLAWSPFIPFSRINPRISPFSSLAHTTKTSAMGELVIHILEPVSTYSSPTSLALDFMEPGSDP